MVRAISWGNVPRGFIPPEIIKFLAHGASVVRPHIHGQNQKKQFGFISYNVDLEHEDSETGAWFDLSEQ
jgi:hypothetical protein